MQPEEECLLKRVDIVYVGNNDGKIMTTVSVPTLTFYYMVLLLSLVIIAISNNNNNNNDDNNSKIIIILCLIRDIRNHFI